MLTATIAVTVNALQVKPDTSYTVQPASVDTQSYTVKNLSTSGAAITVKPSKSCATFSCTLLDSVISPLSPGGWATVRIKYTATSQGTADLVKLIAKDSLMSTSADTGIVTVSVPVPLAPTVSTTPHNGDNHSVGLCVAGCFDLTLSYSTPAYQSMGVARSATLVYNSAQARPLPVVQVDVTDPSTYPANSFALKLKDGGAYVNFRNHSQVLYDSQTVAGAITRLAGQLDTAATTFSTGVRYDSVTVVSNWTSGPYSPTTTTTTVPVVLLLVNEQSSVFGAGWSLAGLQRMYFPDSLTFAVTDGAGSITRFTRTCGGTCSATAVADFTTIVPIDSSGVRVRYERHARNGSVAAFSAAGYLTYVADRFTDTTRFAYDGSNRISTITDPASKALTFAYNATTGKLSSITDPGGRVTSFFVSADLDSIKDVTNTFTFKGSYDGHHLLKQRTDRGGNTWTYFYDFASKLASDSTPTVNVDTAITGTSASLRATRLGAAQRSLERVILIDTAASYGTSGTPAPQRVSAKVRATAYLANGDSMTYKVDRLYAPLQAEQLSRLDTAYLTRDSSERVTASLHRVKLKTVASTSATFDGPRLASATDWLARSSVSYTYDNTFDIPTKITGSTPTVRNYLNATKTWIDSTRIGSDTVKDSVTFFTHDSKGRVTRVLDPKRDTTFTYIASSGFQNVDSVRSGSRTMRFLYDTYGRLVRTVNPRGDSAALILDALNRPDTAIASNGTRTAIAYDALSNVQSVTDAKGQLYQYYYNPLGWADSISDATAGHFKDRYEFTRLGATRAHIDRNAKRTTVALDHLGRDSVLTIDGGRQTTFAYDSLGLWAAVANGESIDTVMTDTTSHTTTQITHRGTNRYVIVAKSDTLGLPRSRVFTMGTDTTSLQRITYGYDADWRMDSLSVQAHGESIPRLTGFGFNGDGMMIYRKLMRGASNTTLIDSTAYATTAVHQRYAVTHSNAALAGFAENYTRDSLERITRRTTSFGDTAWTYSYDKQGQLTNYTTLYYSGGETCTPDPHAMDGQHCTGSSPATVQSTAYSYDSVGNRTDGSPTIAAGNRLTSWLGYTLTYDSVGNMVHKQKTGFDQYLYWNSAGQLDSVKTGGSVVSFGYDGFGRRTRKMVGTVVYSYIYDSDQILTIDSSGTRVRTYSYYPGVDQPHSVALGIAFSPPRLYYLSESGSGSVWGLIDSSGVVKDRYRFTPFGALADSVDSVARNPYKFTGREYDTETQMYFYRARYYDPALSRFVSEDPIGLNGGINDYSYAQGDPQNETDPSGLCSFGAAGYACIDPWSNPRCIPKTDGSCKGGGAGGSSCVPAYQEWGYITRSLATGAVLSIGGVFYEPLKVCAAGGGGSGSEQPSEFGVGRPINTDSLATAWDKKCRAAGNATGTLTFSQKRRTGLN